MNIDRKLILIPALFVAAGGGAGALVLSADADAPPSVEPAAPVIPHLASSAEWAPPVDASAHGEAGTHAGHQDHPAR